MLMRWIMALIFGLWLGFSASLRADEIIAPLYDSATQIILDGEITDGVIIVKDPEGDIESQIREQLRYTLGQLNWHDAAPKISWFRIQIGKKESLRRNSELYRVRYQAKGHIAWAREQKIPPQMELILPARGDEAGLKSFFKRYLQRCSAEPDEGEEAFFYHFFPLQDRCPLAERDEDSERGLIERFAIRFRTSPTNTSGKSPEYGKLWEDGKLVVTLIFSRYEEGASSPSDPGVAAYHRFYSMLLNMYGTPNSGRYGRDFREMVYRRFRGNIEIQMVLLDTLSEVDSGFKDWYSKRTQVSDLVIYNGHAGLGDNVEALSKMGVFTPGRYQIFWLNGCDTFTYLNEQLFEAHGKANPGSAPSRHLDILTNSMSNYFERMADESVTMILEMERSEKTYRQILARFDSRQRAVVDGEEDNHWPLPF